ncbi:protein-tyrosine phosphatase [Microbacterium paludicola]|jgi:protein-tyrosine phosphatase|uniref:protein-tyrosine-phosphatase n=3 Tax=Microbacterium TaxID=33882 RepID=A0ABU1I1M3_9MICO|nr:protein-tyrosine phosphatase [Microbacterium paludicola]
MPLTMPVRGAARTALVPAGGRRTSAIHLCRKGRILHNGTVTRRAEPFRVMFVCTGNICRSPMADVVFRWFIDQSGLGDRVVSASSGTGDWHVGEPADGRTLEALERRGYDGRGHRARRFTLTDFDRSDLIVALDRSHERVLSNWARTTADTDKLGLLMSFDAHAGGDLDVPDPYYGDAGMFDEVLAMIESASRALFRQLEPAIRTTS